MGIMGILVTVISQVMAYQMKAQATMDFRAEALDFKLEMLELLSNGNLCQLNFQNVNPTTNPNSPNPTQVIDDNAQVRAAENQRFRSSKIEVASINFVNYQPYASTGLDRFKGTVDLQFILRPIVDVNGVTEIMRDLKLAVHLKGFSGATPDMEIQTCVAIGQGIENVWKSRPGGDIYYSGNNVAIGTSVPAERLHVVGNVQAEEFLYPSDRQLKDNIHTTEGINKILELRGVDFTWKENGRTGMGLIAQDVEKIYPHLVHTSASGQKSVNYAPLIGPLIESNRDLYLKQKALEERIEQLEQKLLQLRSTDGQ